VTADDKLDDWPASYVLTGFVGLDVLRCVWTQQSCDIPAYVGGGVAAYFLTVLRLLPLTTPAFPAGQSWFDELAAQLRQVGEGDWWQDLDWSNERVELVMLALVVSVLTVVACSWCCGGTSRSATTSSLQPINVRASAAAATTVDFIPCETYDGFLPGYVFKTGPNGRGYYAVATSASGEVSGANVTSAPELYSAPAPAPVSPRGYVACRTCGSMRFHLTMVVSGGRFYCNQSCALKQSARPWTPRQYSSSKSSSPPTLGPEDFN
jgi:hypothetical protein